jgi:hypothetical protein
VEGISLALGYNNSSKKVAEEDLPAGWISEE